MLASFGAFVQASPAQLQPEFAVPEVAPVAPAPEQVQPEARPTEQLIRRAIPAPYDVEPLAELEPDVDVGKRAGWRQGAPCSDGSTIKVSFMLRHSAKQHQKLHDHLMAVSSPDHASYGKHLTRDELANLTAVPDGVETVTKYLAASGVHKSTIAISPTHDAVTVGELPCFLAETLFSTTIHHFKHNTYKMAVHRASKGYSLPESVAKHVRLVAPLARLPSIHYNPHREKINSSDANPLPDPKLSNVNFGALDHPVHDHFQGGAWPTDCGQTCHGSYDSGRFTTPKVLRELYNITGTARGHMKGSMAVASFQMEYWNQDGLDEYTESCGLNKVAVTNQVGPNEKEMCTNAVGKEYDLCTESMMDMELIKAVGGDVPLTVVYNDDYSIEGWALTLNAMSDADLPLVNSISYGDDEVQQDEDASKGQTGKAYMDAVDTEFMKLGLRGATIVLASGDQGVWGRSGVRNGHRFHADYPGGSPYVTSVGGTNLKVPHVIGEEQAWDAGGGGFSERAARPEWQDEAVQGYLAKAGDYPPKSLYYPQNRGYPDLSALGGLGNAYCVMIDPTDGWYGIGGTSASCPVVAGMFARINDMRLKAGKPPMGFINPFLYKNAWAFNDIQYGENKEDGFVGFRASEGWDPATGLGTPNFARLAHAAMKAWARTPSIGGGGESDAPAKSNKSKTP